MKSSVTVVIPLWNQREMLQDLLRDLDSQTCGVAEVIIVDNGSTDGAPEAAVSLGDGRSPEARISFSIRVIYLGANRGFAAAVNRGIQDAKSEWVALINTDVRLERSWLEALLCEAELSASRQVWFATGKILNAHNPDLLDGTFDLVCRGGTAWRAGSGRPDGPEFAKVRVIQIAPGTAAIFRRELFDRIGFFDEIFESYLEDVDFGLRCVAFGCAGIYVPAARCRHMGSASLGRWHPEVVRRMARNQVFLVARHLAGSPRWPVYAAQYLWGLVALQHGCGRAWLQGHREGLRGRGEIGDAPTTPAPSQPVRMAPPDQPHHETQKAIDEMESEILRLQRDAGFDLYWRLYFLLTRPFRARAGAN